MNGFRRFVSPWLALLLLSAVVGCPRPQPTTGPAVGDGSTDKPREGAVPAEPPKYKDLLTLPVLAAEDMRKTLAQPPRALPAFQVVPHRLAFIPNSQALISKAKATVIVEKWNALEALGRVKEGTTETVPEPLGDYPGFGCAIIRL